jgi:hypothetical protein
MSRNIQPILPATSEYLAQLQLQQRLIIEQNRQSQRDIEERERDKERSRQQRAERRRNAQNPPPLFAYATPPPPPEPTKHDLSLAVKQQAALKDPKNQLALATRKEEIRLINEIRKEREEKIEKQMEDKIHYDNMIKSTTQQYNLAMTTDDHIREHIKSVEERKKEIYKNATPLQKRQLNIEQMGKTMEGREILDSRRRTFNTAGARIQAEEAKQKLQKLKNK